ncbi:DUF2306 domain-containing protein [Spirosoma agri]|uniref:DUF2306 domain-containing protein n=1 Tax=Spirosoma agri TaxID=1987381 RepID=A0A6M0IGY7_9BACT|nr:DUF2306 domain-containing protein [Spirosoma agri]NEU67468.1 DUF2306 domain-containing protein [Spirosoma agri]
MVHSTLGFVHLIASLSAMLMGTIVILNPKRGTLHKRMGYAYVLSMLVLNLTVFQIYHLFGRFGPFHWLAMLSLLCLFGGFIPALIRRHVANWLHWHYYFMTWSVAGLYAAFWAELLTRTLPMGQFWPMVFVATGITMGISSYLIRKHASRLLASHQG